MKYRHRVTKALSAARSWVSGPARANGPGSSPVWRWHLDFPSASQEPRLEAGALVVQGWVLFEDVPDATPEVVVRWSGSFEIVHGLQRPRPDVIAHCFPEPSGVHPQLHCGFRFTVPLYLVRFQLLVRVGGQEWLLENVEPPAVDEPEQRLLKVLQGREGWLFLDNDTNNSVDQFTGRLRLTPAGLGQWRDYFNGLDRLVREQNLAAAMLIAPSKEAVLGDLYHPMAPGKPGPVEQVLGLPDAGVAVHPVAQLKAMGDDSFHQTDTHWTPKGALAGVLAVAEELGLDMEAVQARFAQDVYRKVKRGGDLGTKLDPPQSCQVEVLHSFHFQKHRAYDNGLPNFGRLMVTRYEKALLNDTCLVFGSSSSYSMLNYLGRLFQNLVFVHSAGNVDTKLLLACQPRYLITQTNARFVVVAPSVGYSLQRDIEDKVSRLTEEQLEAVDKRRVEAGPEGLQPPGLSDWQNAMLSAVEKKLLRA